MKEEKDLLNCCTNEKLDRLLLLKLESEYNENINNLMEKTPKEIIEHAYEITIKKELINTLMNSDLYGEEELKMLGKENMLNEFYQDWLKIDSPLDNSMIDSINETIKRNVYREDSR